MNEFNTYNDNSELDWDGVIEQESSFTLLPAGEYDFTVVSFDRKIYNGGEKLPRCPQAELHIEIKAPQGTVNLNHNLFITRKTEGILCEFFISIGQKKHGEPLKMNWSAVPGTRGRCKLGVRTYNGNEYNEIKKFLAPAATQQASGYIPGSF